MQFQPNQVYHTYNQGNHKQIIFNNKNDYLTFLNLFRNVVKPYTSIIAYCLMPNHFHFILSTDERCNKKIQQGGLELDAITNGFRKLLSSYARIYNSRYNQSGSLFRQKTKNKSLSELQKLVSSTDHRDYYFSCFHYIHQNPLKAGLVEKLEDWEFSSFKDYAGLRNGTLIDKFLATKYCGYIPD